MVRKQVYIERRQDELLERRAEARGVTQAEFIREALEWSWPAAGAPPRRTARRGRRPGVRLAKLLGTEPEEVLLKPRLPTSPPDVIAKLAGSTFVIEWKGSGGAAAVSNAVDQVRRSASSLGKPAVPLVAVTYMGPVGRQLCEDAGVAWLDLSGNASVLAPGIHVRVEGQPNRFKRRGRPSSAFAPKSARIARWLLMNPGRAATQREIARATNMGEGFTSRIVSKLEEDHLLVREPDGAIRARDPDLLLDAWWEDYDFGKHQIQRGHVPARSGHALLRSLCDELRGQEADYAATGLAAAWAMTRFAGFRIATVYLPESPEPELLERLGFRDEARGANVWLVVPNDEGVFHGTAEQDGVRCVHPVQAYLDLKAHPERAQEAADRLRAQLLTWTTADA